MPNEIQVQIIEELDAHDLLTLRATSHRFDDFLAANAKPISRSALVNSFGENLYIAGLFPFSGGTSREFLLRMIHRYHVVQNVVFVIVGYIQRKIYRITSPTRLEQFAPRRRHMERKFQRPTLLLNHFLEELQCMLGQADVSDHGSSPYEVYQSFQKTLIDKYGIEDVLTIHHTYTLLMCVFRQKLRPPTYAGTIERRLRGWYRQPASENDLARVLLLGGLTEVSKILRLSKYVLRVDALETYLNEIRNTASRTPSSWTGRLVGIVDHILDRSHMMTDLFLWPASERLVSEGVAASHDAIPRAFTYVELLVAGTDEQPSISQRFEESTTASDLYRPGTNPGEMQAADGVEVSSSFDHPPIVNIPALPNHTRSRASYAR